MEGGRGRGSGEDAGHGQQGGGERQEAIKQRRPADESGQGGEASEPRAPPREHVWEDVWQAARDGNLELVKEWVKSDPQTVNEGLAKLVDLSCSQPSTASSRS